MPEPFYASVDCSIQLLRFSLIDEYVAPPLMATVKSSLKGKSYCNPPLTIHCLNDAVPSFVSVDLILRRCCRKYYYKAQAHRF